MAIYTIYLHDTANAQHLQFAHFLATRCAKWATFWHSTTKHSPWEHITCVAFFARLPALSLLFSSTRAFFLSFFLFPRLLPLAPSPSWPLRARGVAHTRRWLVGTDQNKALVKTWEKNDFFWAFVSCWRTTKDYVTWQRTSWGIIQLFYLWKQNALLVLSCFGAENKFSNKICCCETNKRKLHCVLYHGNICHLRHLEVFAITPLITIWQRHDMNTR